MKTDEIRRRFLDFFRALDHRICPPDLLVPASDPSLLFTGAGMNQFKDEFYGRGDRSLKRAATCQKCLRTGDIENVGRTTKHLTFFEMLGNFSFGDYFKSEAIRWAWQFMRAELGIPEEEMVVSIYEGDDEAEKTWQEEVGLPREKVFRFGEDENFWPPNARTEGPNGPCGPCSEIFYDAGGGCGKPTCDPSCDCSRYVELYNLVFQQYDRRDDGTLQPLPMQNIDTGMGLERVAAVMQGVRSVFETDIFAPIIETICHVAGRRPAPGSPQESGIRRIADHARAVVFCIADGVIPSNEERGYVVRRLLRRAVRDGLQLGIAEPFMTRLIEPVIEAYADPYPELAESRAHLQTVIGEEEKAFQKTVERGSALLTQHIAALKRQRATVLRGKEVFDLYQTYGFPLEMTESILAEEGMSVDVQGFLREMEAHQQLSRSGAAFEEAVFVTGPLARLQEQHPPSEFTGYSTLESAGELIGIVSEDSLIEEAGEGDKVAFVLDRTPAYAESGGQVGDEGVIVADGGGAAEFAFDEVRKEKGFFLHLGRVNRSSFRAGDRVRCRVDKHLRMATARNHTATHLLHWALRQVLGEHAKQSGSHVSPQRLRFDFANPTELGADRLRRIEDLVNEKILEDEPAVATRMGLSEAREAGAVALFGETYGDIVRVLSIGDFSRELCGGTHCERTGEIGLFRITRESSVAGGVRRIEAVTGTGVLERLRHREEQIGALCETLSTQDDNLLRRAEDLLGEIRSLQKQLQQERERAARSAASGSLIDRAEEVGGVRAVIARMPGGPAALRSAADVLRRDNEGLVCALASTEGDKVALVVGVSADLVEQGVSARELVGKAAEVVGGGGGGRDDLAQAGGPDVERLDEAFDRVRALLRNRP
jgi:alanyl-tRNA synthetase